MVRLKNSRQELYHRSNVLLHQILLINKFLKLHGDALDKDFFFNERQTKEVPDTGLNYLSFQDSVVNDRKRVYNFDEKTDYNLGRVRRAALMNFLRQVKTV